MLKLFHKNSQGLTFAIKVVPNSKKLKISDIFINQDQRSVLKLYTTFSPTEGKANRSIIDLLAKAWKLKPSQFEILLGSKQRNKILQLKGDPEELLLYLQKNLPS